MLFCELERRLPSTSRIHTTTPHIHYPEHTHTKTEMNYDFLLHHFLNRLTNLICECCCRFQNFSKLHLFGAPLVYCITPPLRRTWNRHRGSVHWGKSKAVQLFVIAATAAAAASASAAATAAAAPSATTAAFTTSSCLSFKAGDGSCFVQRESASRPARPVEA